jgi:hypothetical protein
MKLSPLALAYVAAGAAGLFALYKLTDLADLAPGILSGDNALTRDATNAAGESVTAYQGAGVVGTVAAATNKASGGYLASAGEALGGWFARVTGADGDADIAAMLKEKVQTKQAQYQRPTITSGQPGDSPPPASFFSMGGSFKDGASPDAINSFFNPTPSGALAFR